MQLPVPKLYHKKRRKTRKKHIVGLTLFRLDETCPRQDNKKKENQEEKERERMESSKEYIIA